MIDISNDMYIIRAAICEAAAFISAPSVTMRPRIFPDGDQWCVLLGEDLMVGIVGFGETPEKACRAFDIAFGNATTPNMVNRPAASDAMRDAQVKA